MGKLGMGDRTNVNSIEPHRRFFREPRKIW